MIRRDAMLEAMGAAAVHADVARDGAGELRRGIGRVKEPVGHDGVGDAEIGDARLHARHAVGVIDVKNPVELGDADDDRVLLRNGAARKRGARAARHDLDAGLVQIAQHDGDFLRASRQDDRQRDSPIGGQRVGFIGAALVVAGDHAFRRQQGGEARDDFLAAGEDGGVGRGEGDMGHERGAG